jgi:lactoylglutathione lyase
MVGYVPEVQGFALELTYNYGIDSYAFGNDLQYIAVQNPVVLRRAAALGYSVSTDGIIRGPDNYNFKVIPAIAGRAELFVCVAIRVRSLDASLAFWCGVLGMHQLSASAVPQGLEVPPGQTSALLAFNDSDTYLQLIEVKLQ